MHIREFIVEEELPSIYKGERGDIWHLKHIGSVDGVDLGAGGLIDIFIGHDNPENTGKHRYFIRGQRNKILRPVPGDHKAVRRHFFPDKI